MNVLMIKSSDANLNAIVCAMLLKSLTSCCLPSRVVRLRVPGGPEYHLKFPGHAMCVLDGASTASCEMCS